MSKANIDFIERFMQMEMEKRVITEVVIDPKAIKDGDLLLARRLDGIDPFVMVATGGHVAHAAVAMWEDD